MSRSCCGLLAAGLFAAACSSGAGEGAGAAGDAGLAPASADAGDGATSDAGAGLDAEAPADAGGEAGAGDAAGGGGDALVVPEGLTVMALPGGNGVLEVTALTLREGPGGLELYAALENVGEVPACSAALSVELFDASEQSLAAGIGGLLTQGFYRLTDGSDSIAACVGPGDVTMAAITDWPPDVALDEVRFAVYRCPYFALEVVPIAGLSVEAVTPVVRGTGTAYTGTLVNGLDVAVHNPSVTVFPVDRSGRPLGAAMGSGTVEVPPGGSWEFETGVVEDPGVDQVAYPAGALGD